MAGKKIKILTIDDEAAVRTSFRTYLEDNDYQVLEADNGRVGLQRYAREKPDLVLLDLRLPEIDGLDVLAAIREQAPDVPVIVVSGTGVIGDVVRAVRLGASNYLLKPIEDLTILGYSVSQALERATLLRENRLYQQQLETQVEQRTAELRLHQEQLEDAVEARTRDLKREILERQAAESLLRASEQRFRDVAESASDWIWEMDENLRFSYFSERFREIFHCARPQEYLGKTRIDLASAEELESNPEKWQEHLGRLEQHQPFRGFEYEIQLLDGERITVQLSGKPLFDEMGKFTGYRGTGRDISDLRSAQNKLIQAEKMAALGGLVAGVAHEINTPVGIGVTASSHLRLMVDKFGALYWSGEAAKQDLEEFLEELQQAAKVIESNLKRAADLIHSFKQVAVDQSTQERRIFNLGSYLKEILLSLNPRLKRTRHRVQVHCPPEMELDSYPGALSQILTNLVMNSLIHGFEDGQKGSIDIDACWQGGDIMLTYRDDGCGMAPEQVDRIFDPYYTTKRGSGGSGLGMNVVYNLVTETLGGRIDCSTSPGQGLTYQILLPARAVH